MDDVIENATLKLQRQQQQLDQLTMESDVGRFKWMRWNNLAQYDYNPERIQMMDFKRMVNYDNIVASGWDLITMGCLMKEWRIVHPNDEIVKVITSALQTLERPNFRDAMKEMMKAILYGSTVTEVVFDDYEGGQYWMPRVTNGLKTFDPETIRYYTDDYGNLLKIVQLLTTYQALPVERCILWTHEKEWGNWYGKSILRAVYRNWYIKEAMMKFANIGYERFGSPIMLGIANNFKDRDSILNTLQHLYSRSQGVIVKNGPDDQTDIKVLESKHTELGYERYIKYHDDMILRRMVMSTKIFEGGGGTYGPKIQLDLVFMRFEDFRTELAENVNQLLRMITDLNWMSDSTKGIYPTIEFAPLTTMDQNVIIQKLWQAIDRGVVWREEPWVRDELNFPPISDADKTKLDAWNAEHPPGGGGKGSSESPKLHRDPNKMESLIERLMEQEEEED